MNWGNFWRSLFSKLSKYSGWSFLKWEIKNLKLGSFKTRYIFLVYFLITIFSSLVLFSPWAQSGKRAVSYLDALFTSASAFSDTGLVTLPTYETWSIFGQALIAFLIVLGGLGVFALKIFIFNYLFRLKSSHTSRNLVNAERGSSVFGNTKTVIINSLSVISVLILLFGLSLSLYFYFVAPSSTILKTRLAQGQKVAFTNPYGNWALSFRFGFFHTISAINNAGFDIISGNSLMPYYNNYTLQLAFVFLFFIGGIGYPLISDLVEHIKVYFHNRKHPNEYRKLNYTLFTKISLITYFTVGIIILVLTYAFEISSTGATFWNLAENGNAWEKSFALFFNATTTRSAGFASSDLNSLSPATLIVFSIAMFIGASPSSTGGGIRITTLALILMAFWARLSGRNSIRAFKRKIPQETVQMAFVVTTAAFILVTLVTFIGFSSLSSYRGMLQDTVFPIGISNILFEVTSAFGTTGLSTGITSKLNAVSKVFLIFTMFIGQLGISSTISSWRSRKTRIEEYDFIEEGVAIG